MNTKLGKPKRQQQLKFTSVFKENKGIGNSRFEMNFQKEIQREEISPW